MYGIIKEVGVMPATTGMKGAGYYDQHSTTQLSSIEALQDWVDAAVANLPLPALDEPVTVLDMGSSEGRNAVRLMATIVAGLRRRTDQPLQTIYSRAVALEIPVPFIVEFKRAGDVAAYSAAYTGFLRAISEPVVRAALEQTESGLEIVESLYERIRDRLLIEPERYLWRYILVAALLTRR
jgi:hypothetical protein